MVYRKNKFVVISALVLTIFFPTMAYSENGQIVDVPGLYQACQNQRDNCESQTSGLGLQTCFNDYRACLVAVQTAGASQNADALYHQYGYVPPKQSSNQPAVAPGNGQTP